MTRILFAADENPSCLTLDVEQVASTGGRVEPEHARRDVHPAVELVDEHAAGRFEQVARGDDTFACVRHVEADSA
jgi:hypothetical protein